MIEYRNTIYETNFLRRSENGDGVKLFTGDEKREDEDSD